jgi:hypothetical protein
MDEEEQGVAMDVELEALKLRVALLEKLFVGVLVSELKTTAARNRQDAVQLAASQVEGYADAIPHQFPASKAALDIFSLHVRQLKSLVETSG